MVRPLRLDGRLCRSRGFGAAGQCCPQPAFEALSHGLGPGLGPCTSRTFYHHKSLATAPQPRSVHENFRVATPSLTATRASRCLALNGRQPRIVSASRYGYRLYSRSSTPSIMTEVEWTGARVRKAFLDFFAERGHSIGKSLPLNTPPLRSLFTCARHK